MLSVANNTQMYRVPVRSFCITDRVVFCSIMLI